MRTLLLAGLLALGACKIDVDYTGTYYQCNPDGACPDGYECQDMVCIPTDPEPPACSTDVAAGGGHTCAIREGGTVWCWGRNDKGQLGDGTATDSDVPVQVTGVIKAVRVGAGDSFSCALDDAGVVSCWGANETGQLGDGTMGDSRAPVSVSGVTNATQLAVGRDHSCVILDDDSVACWGANGAGQIGDGSMSTRILPTPVSQLPPSREITAGTNHTCAVDMQGAARCWGENDDGELGAGDTLPHLTPVVVVDVAGVTSISAGDDVTCAVAEGFARCWGENDSGQLGNNEGALTSSDRPVYVITPVPLLSVRAGDEHVCGADRQGDLYCWGSNGDGRLGDGSFNSRPTASLSLFKNTVAFALGREHTCAVDERGAIRCAGFNLRGALGDGRRVSRGEPTTIEGITNAVDVTLGGAHSCVSLLDGRVMCWGSNSNGQVGDGGFSEVRTLPSEVFGLRDVTEMVAGSSHTCALTAEGPYCWGNNDDGRIGDPTNTPSAQPRKVYDLDTVKSLHAGDFSTCAVTMNNEPRCWGGMFSWPPVLGGGLTEASDVGVGQDFQCFQELNGPVRCTGTNFRGQLGDGTQNTNGQTSTPANLGTVVDLQSRGQSSCAVASDGTVKCWGLNDGRLGTGPNPGFINTSPTAVMGLSGVAQLALGWEASCARKTDGTVWCWGLNYFGQAGDNTYAPRYVAAQILGLTGATDIAAGRSHMCAVNADGTVACWGLDTSGQLGLGIRQIVRPVGVRMTCD